MRLCDSSLQPAALAMQDGNTPFHTACEHGNIDILTVLAKDAAQIALDAPGQHRRTPLHVCASARGGTASKSRCIAVLARYGADLDAVDSQGLTPLHEAARCGNLVAVKALVKAGCSMHMRTVVSHFSGATLLMPHARSIA